MMTQRNYQGGTGRRGWLRFALSALAAGGIAGCGSGAPTEYVSGPAQAPAAQPTAPATNPGAIVPAATGTTTPTAAPAPTGSGTADPPFTKEAVLAGLSTCAGERFTDFQTQARALKTAADAWAGAPADMAAQEGMRTAWKAAMASWQEAELFRIGPAAAMFMGGPMIPGAMNLRNEIYGFPMLNTCTIDQYIVSEKYKTFPMIAYDARGLAALEYLAFNVGTANTCADAAATGIKTAWDGLGAMLAQRRALYAQAAAGDVVVRADQLAMAWSATGGNFQAALATGGAPYTGQQAAFQALSDAMFYIDKELKDYKLGRPLKLTMECMTPTAGVVCGAEAVESRIAGVSTDNLKANLRAFRRLFEGCGAGGAGLGVDAWLKAAGLTDLATRMQTAVTELQTTLDAAPALATAVTADPASVMNLHAKVKALTDLMKTEFLSMLELQPPPPMTPPASAPPAAPMTPTTPMAGQPGTAPPPMMPVFPGGFDGD
jgi:uncharacterized protein